MPKNSKPTALRRLGSLELFSSARHHLGTYRCVVVTGRYILPLPAPTAQTDLEAAIFTALGAVVRDQPMLRVGILGDDTSKATFSHLEKIDLRDYVEWRQLEAQGGRAVYESKVIEAQGSLHNRLFTDIATRSPWRVLVARPEQDDLFPEPHIDVFFAFHHALSDGTGGKEFHQHLLAALNTPSSSSTADTVIEFPEPPKLPDPQEDSVPWKTTAKYLLRSAWDEFLAPSFLKDEVPRIWYGLKVDFALPYITLVNPVDWPSALVAKLLAACRANSTTLTALVHALVLASLARRLSPEEAPNLASSTPISLRPYLRATEDRAMGSKMRVLVTEYSTPHPKAVLDALRAPDAALDDLVWESAKRVKGLVAGRTSTLPVDDKGGLAHLITDKVSYWREKDGQPRENSWEVSNLGVMKTSAPTNADGSAAAAAPVWSISRVLFTNSAMVAESPIGFNVATAPGGHLTIALSWQKKVVSDELIAGAAQDLRDFGDRFDKTGKFFD